MAKSLKPYCVMAPAQGDGSNTVIRRGKFMSSFGAALRLAGRVGGTVWMRGKGGTGLTPTPTTLPTRAVPAPRTKLADAGWPQDWLDS